tara:strand:- start:1156 stop:1974 length:819 start_codon:yes stop_codon:yes gene_type:complete
MLSHSSEVELISQFTGFLETPDIRDKYGSEIPIFEFPEVDITEELIAELKKIDHPRNSVLGKRMESFFEIAIKFSKRYKLIASNIQVNQQKITLGELDFLLYDFQNKIPLHVELVYKIYILDPEVGQDEKMFIGPNRKDSFLEKMEKITTKQLPLLKHPETQIYLKKYDLDLDTIEQQICFKAQLYSNDPDATSQNGKYLSLQEFKELDKNNAVFYAPKKNLWSAKPESCNHWHSYAETMEEISELFQKEKSPLIWMKHKDSFSRFFVVWWK